MKAFSLLALIPRVAGEAAVPFTAFTQGAHAAHAAPVVTQHAVGPAHHTAPVTHHDLAYHAAPVVHHAPAYHVYEQPKYNCSVVNVVESAEVCTPAFETVCENIKVPVKRIIDVEQ